MTGRYKFLEALEERLSGPPNALGAEQLAEPGNGGPFNRDPGQAVMTDRPAMQSDVSWFGVLAHQAIRSPDKPVIVFNDHSTTYSEMETRVVGLAGGLSERGVNRGDVVGILSHNCTEFIESIFAASYLGAIAMPINWRLAAPEVRYILEHSQARAIVCNEALIELSEEALVTMDNPPVRVCVTSTMHQGWESISDLIAGSKQVAAVPAEANDIHRLMYTSGTTGRPKGVMITHGNLAWKNLAHIVEFGFTSADLGLACGPLYHVGALDLTTTSLIAAGASIIVHPSFDAAQVVDELERSQVTTVWLAPAMVNAIMALPDIERRDLSSVRLIINGGEKMPIPLIERIQRTFPAAWFADAYGLTETVSGDTFLDRDSIVTKLGSVGRPCLYLELDIWDEEGKSVPTGERGEIVMRGPKVFAGYWRDPEATAAAFAGGWFHTGDIGVRDDDDYLFIVDRLKDMIVSGGENIASSEVERVLYEHESVLEAAVVAQADARWGEVPVAFVVLRPEAIATAEMLLEHCRAHLARYKVPKAITLLDALPRNPSGKVLKRELREQ
jgi:fatty-acyl-CoA synthase